MDFDCFLCGKELLCMDSMVHEMKGLTRDQVLSMHHLTKQLRTFENLPYHVSVNDVSEMIVLIGTNKNPLKIVFVSCYCELNFLYLYLKLLISLLQEFISWLSSVSPEDSVLVCWDDEVTLSKLFCTC